MIVLSIYTLFLTGPFADLKANFKDFIDSVFFTFS